MSIELRFCISDVRKLMVLSACFATLPIAACKGQNLEDVRMSSPNPAGATAETAVAEAPPLRNLNPAPSRAYEIRVSVAEAPGPFVAVEGVAQYDVENAAECGAPEPVSGAIPRITSNEPIALSKVSDTEYAGTVYVDRIRDEDYFGRGVCRWSLVEARVRLQGATDERATRFVAALPAPEIEAEGDHATYFWKGHYPHAQMTGYATSGHASLDHVPEGERGEFFTVTLKAAEVQP